jgi:predicted RecA/RadA family phage recombinase
MANNFRYTGSRLPVATASANIAVGDFVVQEGLFGVALTRILSGAAGWLGDEGVWRLPVDTGIVKGDRVGVADLADAVAPTIVKADVANDFYQVGTAISAEDGGYALVLFSQQHPVLEPHTP